MTKRTQIDFSKHELIIEKQDGLLVHHLKKPDTGMDSIMYVNTKGFLAVTGDYSNWIFCREFHPSADGYCDSSYWREKLKIGSCQEPSSYDSERTEAEIREILADPERELNDKDKYWLNDLLSYVDDELEYTYHAYRTSSPGWDSESIPYCKTVSYHFLAILDGFEEICMRIKQQESDH